MTLKSYTFNCPDDIHERIAEIGYFLDDWCAYDESDRPEKLFEFLEAYDIGWIVMSTTDPDCRFGTSNDDIEVRRSRLKRAEHTEVEAIGFDLNGDTSMVYIGNLADVLKAIDPYV